MLGVFAHFSLPGRQWSPCPDRRQWSDFPVVSTTLPCTWPDLTRASSKEVGEVEHLHDPWPDLAGAVQVEQFFLHPPHPFRVALAVIAPLQAGHHDVLHQQIVGLDLRDAAGGKADHHHAAAPGHGAQAGVEDVVAQGIEDDVGAEGRR